jgi:uncharacterized membrane protein YccC
VALGCSPRDRRDTASTTDSVMTPVDSVATDVSRETGDVAHAVRENVTRDYAYSRRDEFRRDINERMQRLDQEIADLVNTTKAGVDKARDSAIVRIRAARRSVARQLDRLGSATENTWDDVSGAINRSVDSLDMMLRAQRPDAKPMGGTGPS